MTSIEVATQQMIASSKPAPDISTGTGGFYECSLGACKSTYANPLTYVSSATDGRDRDIDKRTKTYVEFNVPGVTFEKYWQYVGCHEYKSNGSGILCETFYGTEICEGTRYDLFINSNGEFLVIKCTDDWKHQ